MDILDRFERFFKKCNGCWIWNGSLNWAGYGTFRYGSSTTRAHRTSFELYICSIPEELNVLHTCDNPSCVNPEHLWLGTQADNAEDREEKQRGNHKQGITHGMVKVTESIVRAIRRDRRVTSEIAAQYGLHRGHVSDIKNYKSWSHIPAGPNDEPPRGKGKRVDIH